MMAAHARIVLFSWVWTPAVLLLESPPPGPSRSATRPSQGRSGVGSRRGRPDVVGWRVIGANNRELGRGAHPAESVTEACQAVHAAQLTFGQHVTRILRDDVTGWSWHTSLDGDPVTVSSRGYFRQREADYSLEQFRAFFPTAKVVEPPTLTSRPTRRGPLSIPPVLDQVGPWTVVGGAAEVAR
jgi:hypothetical protein